jgi:hypothetical protein
MTYSYLASPYNHPTPSIMQDRYQAALRITVHLLSKRIWTYSPIVHCHTLALQNNLPTDHGYWMDYNRAMLMPAQELLILTLSGWDDSKGIAEEINIAHATNKPIRFIAPNYTITEDPPQ